MINQLTCSVSIWTHSKVIVLEPIVYTHSKVIVLEPIAYTHSRPMAMFSEGSASTQVVL